MGSPKAIAALTDAFRVARYDTHFKSHPPYSPPKGHEDEGVALDRHASLARNCWVYPLVALYGSAENHHIPFEARINEDGVVLRASPAGSPIVPIPERPDTFLFDPDHPEALDLSNKVDEQGRALMVRMFLSPFRLSMQALKQLLSGPFRHGARAHVPSLWDWSRTAASSLTSSDGWNYVERRTTLKVGGEQVRVWMATDPFHVARRRSDLYVKSRRAYLNVFEPKGPKNKKAAQKRELLFALNDTIVDNVGMPSKYKAALNDTKVSRESLEEKEKEATARRRFTERVEKLIEVLKSPFFSLLQYSSLSPENFDEETDRFSEALAEHIATLNHVMRHLDECAEGIALLNEWIDESKGSEAHFLNQFVLPPRSVRVHVFRTVRWMSKGTVGLIKDLFPKIVSRAKKSAEDAAKALHHLGVFETAEQALSMLGKHKVNLRELSASLNLRPGIGDKLDVTMFRKEALEKLEAFFDLGDSKIPGITNIEIARTAAFTLLDGFNVALAFMAYADAKGEAAVRKATASGVAATTFLVVSIAEFGVKAWKKGGSVPAATRAFAAARAVSGVIYGVLDVLEAEEAQKQGDNDRALALLAAATAEMCAAGILMYQAIAGAAVLATPLAIAGIIAAAAYTAATWLKDDSLLEFLKNCEYGRAPYGDPKYEAAWTNGPVSSWKGDFTGQRDVLLVLLTRFEVSWRASPADPGTGVNIDCGLRTPDMRIEVRFVAVFDDGRQTTETHIFEHERLPLESAAPLVQKVDKPYINLPGIKDLFVIATLKVRRQKHHQELSAQLIEDGVEATSGGARVVTD